MSQKTKKYYAVRVGKKPGIYDTWSECQAQTLRFPGALHQSFRTLAEAKEYMQSNVTYSRKTTDANAPISFLNAAAKQRIAALGEDEIIAFVDGSYSVKDEKSAFGAIIFSYGGRRDVLYKAIPVCLDAEFVALRNVAAELEAVKQTLDWAVLYKKNKVAIYYDYTGIEMWATGGWRANKYITRDYAEFVREKSEILQIEFVKVPAHSNITFNEEVDKLAKAALKAKTHKTYNENSVYFSDYSVQDWEAIVQDINRENAGLLETEIPPVVLEHENLGFSSKEMILISQKRNKVRINCYNNSKSYVQGKQTPLFPKIVENALEQLEDERLVVEVLNDYHAQTLYFSDVESRFKQLLPHYVEDTAKHYATLLSTVYNTMFLEYMPDYACLLTPLFRAYEYYLHKILGDVMGLNTRTDAGIDNFSFFSERDDGSYECNSPQKSLLSNAQLKYLNLLYAQYDNVKRLYARWSFNDTKNAVVADIEIARNLLNDGLSVMDQYYTLFKEVSVWN